MHVMLCYVMSCVLRMQRGREAGLVEPVLRVQRPRRARADADDLAGNGAAVTPDVSAVPGAGLHDPREGPLQGLRRQAHHEAGEAARGARPARRA